MYKIISVLICFGFPLGLFATTLSVNNLTGSNVFWPDSGTWLYPPGVTVLDLDHQSGVIGGVNDTSTYGADFTDDHDLWVTVTPVAVTYGAKTAISQASFWSGFTLVFGMGLLGLGARWVRKIIGGGVEERD
jgi:hypothetical protein